MLLFAGAQHVFLLLDDAVEDERGVRIGGAGSISQRTRLDVAEPENITDQKGKACESRGTLLRPHKRRMKRLEGEHAHKRGAVASTKKTKSRFSANVPLLKTRDASSLSLDRAGGELPSD